MDMNNHNIRGLDLPPDDPLVPAETVIYFSKHQIQITLIAGGIILLLGLISVVFYPPVLNGIVFIGVGIFIIAKNIRAFLNDAPQIILNERGIFTPSSRFQSWKDIIQEEVLEERNYRFRRSDYFLVFGYPIGQTAWIKINQMETNQAELSHLIRVYKYRHSRPATP